MLFSHSVRPGTEEMNIRKYVPVQKEEVAADCRYKPGFMAQMRAFLSGTSTVAATVEESLEIFALVEALYSRAKAGG